MVRGNDDRDLGGKVGNCGEQCLCLIDAPQPRLISFPTHSSRTGKRASMSLFAYSDILQKDSFGSAGACSRPRTGVCSCVASDL